MFRLSKRRSLFGAATALCVLAACDVQDGQYSTTRPDSTTTTTASPVTATQVQIFEGEPTRDYTVIGPVDIDVNKLTAGHPSPTREAAIARLQEAAGRIGADAVINVVVSDVRVTLLSWGARRATGTAVKFQN